MSRYLLHFSWESHQRADRLEAQWRLVVMGDPDFQSESLIWIMSQVSEYNELGLSGTLRTIYRESGGIWQTHWT